MVSPTGTNGAQTKSSGFMRRVRTLKNPIKAAKTWSNGRKAKKLEGPMKSAHASMLDGQKGMNAGEDVKLNTAQYETAQTALAANQRQYKKLTGKEYELPQDQSPATAPPTPERTRGGSDLSAAAAPELSSNFRVAYEAMQNDSSLVQELDDFLEQELETPEAEFKDLSKQKKKLGKKLRERQKALQSMDITSPHYSGLRDEYKKSYGDYKKLEGDLFEAGAKCIQSDAAKQGVPLTDQEARAEYNFRLQSQ